MTRWEQIIRDFQLAQRKFLVILVCGGRDFDDEPVFDHIMDSLLRLNREDASGFQIVIVHGGARGADTLADRWAKSRGIPVVACPADWDKHKKAAGIIRNAEMLKKWHPHVVVAFPGGRGTAHMVSIARKAGVPVHEVDL